MDCDHCHVKNVVVDVDGCCQNCGRPVALFDEPTVILAATSYREAYRTVLALRRARRCTRATRDEHGRGFASCYALSYEPDEACANCNARNDAGNQDEFKDATRVLGNAKRKLHRALGVYA